VSEAKKEDEEDTDLKIKPGLDGLRAAIFDFDGVILESADIKTQAFLDLFADYPEHREAILRHHLDNVGISRFRKFEWIYSQLLGKTLEEHESRHLGEAFTSIVMGKILTCPFVPGAIECLDALKGRLDLFVASGTPQQELELIIERRGLTPSFTEIWGTPATKAEILRSVLARFGLERREVIFVGDGLSDFQAAGEVGIPFLARDSGTGGIDWRSVGARTVTDLKGVLDLLSIGELPMQNAI
jgi:phosphoglycolate phosphatase-like HAD superfamily hydrolase